jgi:Chlorophyll A-B binding protein
MRRNMQERELFNGRAAMIAIAAYILEESIKHKALIDIGTNALLLQPAYEIPFIQEWLDEQFSLSSPLTETGADPTTILDNIDTLDALVQSTMILIQSFLL